MTAPGPLLVLTMPGFGIETLRHLVQSPAWPAADASVALVGPRPPAWRRIAARVRRALQRPTDRVDARAEGALAATAAEHFLRRQAIAWCWLASDESVCAFRARLRPALTLTITSRIVFSEHTLAAGSGEWLNVHPGLLPEYAGASPAPYMVMDGVGGCSIHVMTARVDAGPVLDRAPMAGPVAPDGGEYFFGQLPSHTAARVAALLQRWAKGQDLAPRPTPAAQPLRHFGSRRLAFDRQLDWSWPPDRLLRWVQALAAIAPAWWDDGRGHRVEVLSAAAAVTRPAAPGTVLGRAGRWVEVACAGGVVALRCRSRPHARAGDVLPLRAGSDSP